MKFSWPFSASLCSISIVLHEVLSTTVHVSLLYIARQIHQLLEKQAKFHTFNSLWQADHTNAFPTSNSLYDMCIYTPRYLKRTFSLRSSLKPSLFTFLCMFFSLESRTFGNRESTGISPWITCKYLKIISVSINCQFVNVSTMLYQTCSLNLSTSMNTVKCFLKVYKCQDSL